MTMWSPVARAIRAKPAGLRPMPMLVASTIARPPAASPGAASRPRCAHASWSGRARPARSARARFGPCPAWRDCLASALLFDSERQLETGGLAAGHVAYLVFEDIVSCRRVDIE